MTEIIQTQGIILSLKPHGETSAIIDIFTQQAGLIKGYVKSARSKKNSGIYQKGNLIDLTHTRRLTEQLGTITADIMQCLWQEISHNRLYFKIFNRICDLQSVILPVHVYEPFIYKAFTDLIDLLLNSNIDALTAKRAYVDYLLIVLQQLGFAPNFTQCGVSGVKTDLMYVSPRTVRAICQQVGHEYHDKLLILPSFLANHTHDCSDNDVENGQKIMQLCYNKFILHPADKEFTLIL